MTGYISSIFISSFICILTFHTISTAEIEISQSSEVEREGDTLNSENVVCAIDVCEAINALEKGHITTLTRRILSLEQPMWKYSTENFRWVSCLEGPCNCSGESLTVNCWRRSLDVIPERQIIPFDTSFLDLGSNRIYSIHRHAFTGLTRLVQLDLSDNLLDYLPDRIFEGLESLKYLMLHRNSLDTLPPKIFKDLQNLETLDVSENKLVSLPPALWNPLLSLKILHLSQNKLQEWINFGGLRNLEELDLTSNAVQTMDSFRPLRKLRQLKLGHNEVTSLDQQAFQGLLHLESLSLRHNRIETLPSGVFQSLGKLTTLDLSDNQLGNVTRESFEGLKSLEDLDLSKNSVTALANSTFSDLPLHRLSLNGNNLEKVESAAFAGLQNLSILLLGNNMIQELDGNIFIPTPNLTKIDLDSNDLHNIGEESLEHLSKLQSIKLSRNSWNCDCSILYIANWVRDHSRMVMEHQPKCNTPLTLADKLLQEISFAEVCL